MKTYVPFKLWDTEDKIAFIGGTVIYLVLIISGICMTSYDFVVAGMLFWGGVIGAIIHAYLSSKLHDRDV